jgi:hypothetical protein
MHLDNMLRRWRRRRILLPVLICSAIRILCSRIKLSENGIPLKKEFLKNNI